MQLVLPHDNLDDLHHHHVVHGDQLTNSGQCILHNNVYCWSLWTTDDCKDDLQRRREQRQNKSHGEVHAYSFLNNGCLQLLPHVHGLL